MSTKFPVSERHSCSKRWRQFPFLFNLLFLLISCTPVNNTHATSVPTEVLNPALASNTPTMLELTPTATLTPAPVFADFRQELLPGTYMTYWSQGMWHAKDPTTTDTSVLISGVKVDQLNTDIKFSPDYNLIVFSNLPNTLEIYDLRTGRISSYLHPHANDTLYFLYNFQWALDGKTLLYLATPAEYSIPDGIAGVYSFSLTTGEVTMLIDPKDNRFEYGLKGLALSNNGYWLAFYAPRRSEVMTPDPQYAIYVMDTACLENLGTCAESVRLVVDGRGPVWSSDGRLGWICSDGALSALCIMDIEKSQRSQTLLTTHDLKLPADAEFSRFYWSPDGNYIALNVRKHQPTGLNDIVEEIFLIPLDGGDAIQVTASTDRNEYWEGWSPDGKYLVYSRAFGYTEPYGEYEIRMPKTELFLYDIQSGMHIDLLSGEADGIEVFGSFIIIK
ncbi:MAG: PD40 domain-containing protein [Chloroflexi bacterium]|nr:PD40 domain-containing protein [Chloroflexota bacterium]